MAYRAFYAIPRAESIGTFTFQPKARGCHRSRRCVHSAVARANTLDAAQERTGRHVPRLGPTWAAGSAAP
jgi:hypothetical protein